MKLSPTPKVASAGLGGSVSVVLFWWLRLAGVDIPSDVAAALSSLLSFAMAWLVRDASSPNTHTERQINDT